MTDHISKRITDLLSTVPGKTASNEDRATWFDQKAVVFDAIADDEENHPNGVILGGSPVVPRGMAEAARNEAARLRGGERS